MNLSTLIPKKAIISYGERIRPVRDWFAILACGAVLFIASVAWNAWLFYDATRERAESTATTAEAPALDALPKAREVLTERAGEEARYRGVYEFVDPSR